MTTFIGTFRAAFEDTLADPKVDVNKVIYCLAFLLVVYAASCVYFVRDAFELRRAKTSQTIRIWSQRSFHESIKRVRDGSAMTDAQAQARARAIETSGSQIRERKSSQVRRSLGLFVQNHRVFALFMQEASYTRGPTLLLELVSCLVTVALLEVRPRRSPPTTQTHTT